MDLSIARKRFREQRRNAFMRGIGWELTFEQWLDWWGEDLDKRGVGTTDLQMQRFADKGPYALGNIRKGVPLDNAKTAGRMKRLANTLAAKNALEAARDACEPISADEDEVDEDAHELSKMFGVRSSAGYMGRFAAEKRKYKR